MPLTQGGRALIGAGAVLIGAGIITERVWLAVVGAVLLYRGSRRFNLSAATAGTGADDATRNNANGATPREGDGGHMDGRSYTGVGQGGNCVC